MAQFRPRAAALRPLSYRNFCAPSITSLEQPPETRVDLPTVQRTSPRFQSHIQEERQRGGEGMVKNTTDFAERNSEQIANATRAGVDWVQELTEQNIRQAQAMVITTRKVADDLWEQGSTIRQHSFAVAEATLSNTLDFLQKLSRLKELRELTLIQSEFVSRQAQVLGEGGKELAQTIVQGTGKIVQKASEMTNAEHQRSKAA
jgi:hypothetical protein